MANEIQPSENSTGLPEDALESSHTAIRDEKKQRESAPKANPKHDTSELPTPAGYGDEESTQPMSAKAKLDKSSATQADD